MRFLIMVLCVCGIYGDHSTERAKPNVIRVLFDVQVNSDREAHCIRGIENGNDFEETNEVVIKTGEKLRLQAGIQPINGHIQRAKCTYNNGSGPQNLADEYDIQMHKEAWFEVHEVKNTMYGLWSCRLRFNKDTKQDIRPVDGQGYSCVQCEIAVKKPDVTTTPSPAASEKAPVLNNKILYIIVGVGILVILIIIGQTIALCYFKRKAQPRRRMDNMTPRVRFDRGDTARYSAPPCKKSKAPIPTPDRDSHIYEMVGVNALYNKSSDLDPEVNGASDPNVRDRPPLPLPHEIPDIAETLPRRKPSPMTSLASTLSLNSNSSNKNLINKKKVTELPPPPVQTSKKAPPRPPKQVDEESIPGSLKRPAKTGTLPAPAPACAKSGYKLKAPAADSPVSELKTIFRNRNIGTDTPTSSATATLEKKELSKVQTKQNKKQITPANPTPKPLNEAPKAGPPNQIKLILPKIEVSLKTPRPLHTPKTTEAKILPIKPPLIAEKPQKSAPKVAKKWPPIAQKAIAPEKVKQSVLKAPLQNRPLPIPDQIPLPDTIPDNEDPGLQIYQTADDDDDDTRYTDDDEEWTYEQLEKYNIYNL